MFLRNAWYVACMPDEIREKPLGRKICEQSMVIYRDGDGQVTALEDFCPHRGAALSLGKVIDGQLVCGYHGLVMGCDGRPVAMPGQRVRGFPGIRRFPAVERSGYIWVWPGDADKADPALIIDAPWRDNPEWAHGGGVYHVKCDYRLMIDNLMDLTHETYVHADSIGQKEIDETPCVTRTEGDHVTTSRFMTDIQAPPFWRDAMRGHGLPEEATVDRWQICHFSPPSHVLIEVGVALAGRGGHEAPADVKTYAQVIDFITPESDTTIWYFWGMARHFKPKDDALTARIRDNQSKVFSEDIAVLEGQQRNLSQWPGRRLLSLNIDAGGVQARRVIDRLLAAERAASGQAVIGAAGSGQTTIGQAAAGQATIGQAAAGQATAPISAERAPS
jgi:vanillate O-demethylase monooxygenase subunit